MAHPTGESESDGPRLNFDRRLKLEFHGSRAFSDQKASYPAVAK